jgi:hypothetical protein
MYERRKLAEVTSALRGAPANAGMAGYLFMPNADDSANGYGEGCNSCMGFIAKADHAQVRRLQKVVESVPDAPQRWSEFIQHELDRAKSGWSSCREQAEALAHALVSNTVGKLILQAVFSSGGAGSPVQLRGLGCCEMQALAVAWKRSLLLSVIDATLARKKADGE